MRTGYKLKTGVQRTAQSVALASPSAGLNTRDPVAAMDSSYATNLTNFIATPQGVTVREGYKRTVTGLPGYVETLAPYTSVTGGSDKLFGWSGTSIYDVTTPGAVGAAVVTGLTNAQWTHTNMAGVAGSYLVCANGVDAVRHYDGTSWTTWTTTGSPSAPGQVNGVSVSTLNKPLIHMRRLWFVQENSSKAWYLPIDSLGGTAEYIDFGPAFPRGGKLSILGSWSADGGDGLQNYLIAISENGDAVVYQGIDPSDAANWSITGTWRLAPPVSQKSLLQWGGDLLYLSIEGLMPLTQYMQSKDTSTALSDAIRPTISALALSQGSLSGWALHDVPTKNLIIVNVPQIDPLMNVQFVFNTITKGWSLFTGWPAQCWASLNGAHYFGGFQTVYLAFSGYADDALNDGSDGDRYTAVAQQAYFYGSDYHRARQKRATMARLNMQAGGPPNFALDVNTDFATTLPASVGAAISTLSSLWDEDLWDGGTWGGGLANFNAWQSVTGTGFCLSVNLAISVQSETTWTSTDCVYEVGGIL